MTTENPISPELQAKIDSLPEGSVKKRVIRALTGSGNRTASNDEIFEHIMRSVAEADAQRAQWRQWRNDEVLAFVEYFKEELPDDYVEYLRQERENKEIDSELSWKVEQLSKKWVFGLASIDYILLLSKARDLMHAQLHSAREDRS